MQVLKYSEENENNGKIFLIYVQNLNCAKLEKLIYI